MEEREFLKIKSTNIQSRLKKLEEEIANLKEGLASARNDEERTYSLLGFNTPPLAANSKVG
jgi:chaperonin cofactor prefoldin